MTPRVATMNKKNLAKTLCSLLLLTPLMGHAEILAMVNYDSIASQSPRREGIAILNVDPDSPQFGKIVNDLPLPPDALSHHIFYNKDLSKAYITALGNGPLRVINMKHKPYAIELMAQQFNPKRIANEVFDAIKEYYRLLMEFPSEINEIIYKIKEGKFKTMIEVKGFDPLIYHVDSASNRVSAAIVVAALIIGASIISQWEQTRMAGIIVFGIAGIFGFWLLIKLFRKNKF